MEREHCRWSLLAGLLFIAMACACAQTTGPRVSVNGAVLDAPVRELHGTLLLPMRAVFQALGADVRWFEAARQITVTRGKDTIQLWLDRPAAVVNGREIRLAVPPTTIGGVTYVPLRFPAEALGGNVDWQAAQQLAVVTLPREERLESSELTGILMTRVAAREGNSLVLRAPDSEALSAVTVPAGTPLTRNRAPATWDELETGDLLIVIRDAAGAMREVRAAYQLVDGTIAGQAEGKLLLGNGVLYQLAPQARLQDARGAALTAADLLTGRAVTLRLTPGTTTVWAVTLPAVAPAPAKVQITGITTPDYTHPLKDGDRLTLQVTGTPGADRVTADVGTALTGIELAEGAPGTYTRQITLAAGLPTVDAPIFATLRKGGETCEMQSAGTIVIDMRPPVCRPLDPAPDTTIFDPNPVITAALEDDGAGMDLRSVRLLVNDRDVTAAADITAESIRYAAHGLPEGDSLIQVEMADRAGNTATREWQFSVREQREDEEPEIFSVAHDAVRPLRAGDLLTIRVAGAPGADRATARVGTAVTGIELREQAAGRYTGTVTIAAGVQMREVPVIATLRWGNTFREAQSMQRLSVDTRPPQYTILDNAPLETYDHEYPIDASFSDDDSGIDPRAVRLLVNGRDITRMATITDHDLRCQAVNLPFGTSTFQLEIVDRAGNVTRREWQVVVRERPPIITGITVEGNRLLGKGDMLIIRVSGTPGADEAWARVGTALTRIRLDEERPGRYLQRVTVRDGIHAEDVSVYAVLQRRGQESEEARSERRITLDSEDPDCQSFSPRNGATLRDDTPVIEASFRDEGVGIAPDGVKLLINGQDVTKRATVSDRRIKYAADGLPFGQVAVVLTLEDRLGNRSRTAWSFTLQPPPLIAEVRHGATRTLEPGDTVRIIVRLSAVPTRLEWLLDEQVISRDIAGAGNGSYAITYTIVPSDRAGRRRVGVHCFGPNGQDETRYADDTLSIARLKAKDLAITSPDNDAKVGTSMTVAGVATPGARVRITVTAIATVDWHMTETQVTEITVTASADGLWTTRAITLPTEEHVRRYTASAALLDEHGGTVKTIKVTVKR